MSPPKPQLIYSSSKSKKEKVLWVSRHKPLEKQIKTLEQKLGAVEIWQLSGVVPTAEFVAEIAKQLNAKIIVPVLPLSFIARLAELARKEGFTILFARMRTIAQVSPEEAKELVEEAPDRRTMTTYADGSAKVHEFEKFEKVVKVEIITEPW